MRDIRSDLEERAKLIEDEATRAVAHFDKKIEELRREHDARVGKLRAELAVLNVLMESEQQRMPSGPRPIEPEDQRVLHDSAPAQSELRYIGERIRQLQDGSLTPAASPQVAERRSREPNERRGGY
jgi:hypothetical protein